MNVVQAERAGAVDLLFGRAEYRRDIVFQWSRERISRLQTKAENPAEPEFVRACAQSQLAAAAGNGRAAARFLRQIIEKCWHLYPHSGHFCDHIIQAAICLQNFKLAATIIEDHSGTGEFLRIVPLQSTVSQTANLAKFTAARQCEYWLDPRILLEPPMRIISSAIGGVRPSCLQAIAAAKIMRRAARSSTWESMVMSPAWPIARIPATSCWSQTTIF